METCNRPVVVERLHPVCAVQVGVQPVSSPVHQNFDWLISIDLKDTYLLVPFHPSSRKFLRFVVEV